MTIKNVSPARVLLRVHDYSYTTRHCTVFIFVSDMSIFDVYYGCKEEKYHGENAMHALELHHFTGVISTPITRDTTAGAAVPLFSKDRSTPIDSIVRPCQQ